MTSRATGTCFDQVWFSRTFDIKHVTYSLSPAGCQRQWGVQEDQEGRHQDQQEDPHGGCANSGASPHAESAGENGDAVGHHWAAVLTGEHQQLAGIQQLTGVTAKVGEEAGLLGNSRICTGMVSILGEDYLNVVSEGILWKTVSK